MNIRNPFHRFLINWIEPTSPFLGEAGGGNNSMKKDALDKAKGLIKKTLRPECENCFDGFTYYCERLCEQNIKSVIKKIDDGFAKQNVKLMK